MPVTGADFAIDQVCGYQDVNEIKNSYAGATAPSAPVLGMLWWDTTNGLLKIWYGGAWVSITSTDGEALDGMIVPWVGGYFGDGSNGSYQYVLGSANTIAGANAYLNPLGWYVCDGAAVNQATSAIWVGAGRYLSNLTDDRFIMGDTAAGTIGGSNTRAHTHPVDPPATNTSTSSGGERIECGIGTFAPEAHNHSLDIASFTSGAASDVENRPAYLTCFYIAKVY